MVRKFLNKVINDSKFLCIEILLNGDVKQYHAIEVQKKEETLSVSLSIEATSFADLLKSIPKNRPTLLSFSGQGIISKKIENNSDYRSKLLFNANLDDFYWYEWHQQDYIYASVIRKNILEAEISEFSNHQISIVEVSIGPLVIGALKPLLLKSPILYTPNYKLEFSGNALTDITKNSDNTIVESYEMEGGAIKAKSMVPFSNLLNYLYPSKNILAEKDFLIQKREGYKYKKRFGILGTIALPSFLLTLLISFILLNYYQTKYLDLQVEFGEEKIAYEKMLVLENDVINKRDILNESGLNDSNFLTFYVSEITKQVPREITLEELDIFPPKEKIKTGKRIGFINNLVVIKGVTTSNGSFTAWIKTLKKLTYIDNLEIVDFGKDGEVNNFEIKLTLRFNV